VSADHLSSAARRKLNKPDGWQVVRWEAIGDTDDLLIGGGVPVGIYQRGPRKGRPKFAPPFDQCVITKAELLTERLRFEADTGKCYACENGQEWAGWSRDDGNRFRTCRRCNGSGTAAPTGPNPMTSTEQTAVDLLPCPFCGAAADFVRYEGLDCWAVDCFGDACTVCPGTNHEGARTRETAAERWNARDARDALARHLADQPDIGAMACPDCKTRGMLMYECVACSHGNYPPAQPAAQSFAEFIRSSGPEKDVAMLDVADEATDMQRDAAQEAGAVAEIRIGQYGRFVDMHWSDMERLPIGTKLYTHPPTARAAGDAVLIAALRRCRDELAESMDTEGHMSSFAEAVRIADAAIAHQPAGGMRRWIVAKTLSEIIDAVRDGERVDYDDLRYAVCALEALTIFDRMAFMKLAEAEREGKKPILTRSAQWQWEEHFNRQKRARSAPPKEYVGWNNDPDNPEFQARRKVASKVMERAQAARTQGEH
jgi:hypothetical protein